MDTLIIPAAATPYILYQRTGYFKDNLIYKALTKLGTIRRFYQVSMFLKSFLFLVPTAKVFSRDMKSEYEGMKAFLPSRALSILDIGCGVAGIDALLSRHYRHSVDIFLLDKTTIDKRVHYNFEQQASFYNSLSVARRLLEANGVLSRHIHTQEATDNSDISFNEKFDLVISLLSWGFHYPISTYLKRVYERLTPGGMIIVDVRKNTGGEAEIKKIFGTCTPIFEGKKHIRVMAIKNSRIRSQ